MASEKTAHMLSTADKGAAKAEDILTRLFRLILVDLNMNLNRWNTLMVDYLNNPRNRVSNNSKRRSSARGNLNKELNRDCMTWKVFIKALRFLNPKNIRVIVRLEWDTGRVSEHGVNLVTRATSEADLSRLDVMDEDENGPEPTPLDDDDDDDGHYHPPQSPLVSDQPATNTRLPRHRTARYQRLKPTRITKTARG